MATNKQYILAHTRVRISRYLSASSFCSKESQSTPLLTTQIVVKYIRILVQCRVCKSIFKSKQLMYVEHIFQLRVFVIKISYPEPAEVALNKPQSSTRSDVSLCCLEPTRGRSWRWFAVESGCLLRSLVRENVLVRRVDYAVNDRARHPHKPAPGAFSLPNQIERTVRRVDIS